MRGIRSVIPALVALALVGGFGCRGSSDSGDVARAEAAAAAAPKSVEELPADMPPEAKRGAAAAMGQSQAMQQQMDAHADAMKRARNQGR